MHTRTFDACKGDSAFTPPNNKRWQRQIIQIEIMEIKLLVPQDRLGC